MQFGLSLPGRGPLATPDAVVALARKAESLRYASLFVSDHVVIPVETAPVYPYSPTGHFPSDWAQGYLEPVTVMSYLAGATSKIRLGTSVLIVPYRNPVVTAKMLATLDVLSGGRIILGAGVGWMREEFEALQAPPFAERGRVTDEYLRLMRECWTREPVEFSSAAYRLSRVSAMPKPLQKGGIPIWIGGHTDAALRRAAELGDAWHPIGLRPPAMLYPEEYGEKVKRLHDWARRAGREPQGIALTFRAPLQLVSRRAKTPAGDRLPFRGTAPGVVQDIRAYQRLGVTHFVFDPVPEDLRERIAMMERFAEEVRPKVARGPG